jgi:predicted permease
MLSEWFTALRLKVMALINHRRLDRDLDEELRFHLAMRAQEKAAEGMSAGDAHAAAQRQFGNATLIRETCRELWSFNWIETLWRELCYAARTLVKSPAFSVVAILSLGLGIGGNVAIFTLIDEMLLRTLPVQHPEQLVVLANCQGGTNSPSFSHPLFLELRQHQQVLSGVCASGDAPLREVRNGGSAEVLPRLDGRLVSENYFAVLGVGAVQGRVFSPNEEADAVTVISYGFWQRQFAKAPSAIGSTLGINGTAVTIIGVAPPKFFGESVGRAPDLWLPLYLQPRLASENWLENGAVGWLRVLGRKNPKISDAQAEAALSVVYQNWVDSSSSGTSEIRCRIKLEPGSKGLQEMRQQFSRPLWMLMGAVGLILLIVCINLASLLLARATARRHEIGLRLALGASRMGIIRQLLVESLLLSFVGGTVGIGVAMAGVPLLLALISDPAYPYVLLDSLDVRLLAFAACLSIATAVAFGLVPALRASLVGLNTTLKGSTVQRSAGLHQRRITKGLVSAQVALSLVFLVGATLLMRSLRGLYQVDTGFRLEGLLTVHVPMGASLRLNRNSMQRDLLNRLTSVPGVLGVGLGTYAPLTGGIQSQEISVQGYPERNRIGINLVSAGYFATAGITLLNGRDFSTLDTASSQKVTVINRTMSRRCFGNQSPIGKLFSFGAAFDPQKAVLIVGVVEDARYSGLRESTVPLAFIPLAQRRAPIFSLIIRTAAEPLSLLAPIRQALRQVDPELATGEMSTLNQTLETTLVQEHLMTRLCTSFGLLALTLTCVGLYGTISYSVARRIPEIGIRMALGARRADALWLVLREATFLVVTGLAFGMPSAMVASRLLKNVVFGLATTDPSSYVIAAAILSLVCLAASYVPALRASRVDPAVTLRNE